MLSGLDGSELAHTGRCIGGQDDFQEGKAELRVGAVLFQSGGDFGAVRIRCRPSVTARGLKQNCRLTFQDLLEHLLQLALVLHRDGKARRLAEDGGQEPESLGLVAWLTGRCLWQ